MKASLAVFFICMYICVYVYMFWLEILRVKSNIYTKKSSTLTIYYYIYYQVYIIVYIYIYIHYQYGLVQTISKLTDIITAFDCLTRKLRRYP